MINCSKLFILATLLLPLVVFAENSTRAEGYTIHHNALPVTALSPEMVGAYGLVRSKYRGLLNISIIKDIPNTVGQAVAADVSAYATNLIGQQKNINLKEVREGDAIYYIGDYPIINLETLSFYLTVQPEGLGHPLKAKLTQQFFID